jgi:hypothetical protein
VFDYLAYTFWKIKVQIPLITIIFGRIHNIAVFMYEYGICIKPG